MAWVLGRRDTATARRWWQALPRHYRWRCWYFTDLSPACLEVLPRWHHRPYVEKLHNLPVLKARLGNDVT